MVDKSGRFGKSGGFGGEKKPSTLQNGVEGC